MWVTHQSVSKPISWFRIGLPCYGIDKEALMRINNKWPMVLEITMLDGTRTHCICICNGWIYDSNSIITLQKSIINLDLCSQLHVAGSHDNFSSTSIVYYFLPTMLNFGKINKLSLTTPLLSPVGFEYNKMRQCDKCTSKKIGAKFLNKQWRSSNKGTRKCKDCIQ